MKKGFTLVEIMIVVAIIALLAAIAIPNLLRQRITANESAAQATLRTISTAFETYAAAHDGSYDVSMADLATKSKFDPPYLNQDFTACTKAAPCHGYGYAYTAATGGAATGYTITGKPSSCTTSGTKSFTVTTGGVLSTDGTCSEAS